MPVRSAAPRTVVGSAGRTAIAVALALVVIVGTLLSFRYGAVVQPLLDALR